MNHDDRGYEEFRQAALELSLVDKSFFIELKIETVPRAACTVLKISDSLPIPFNVQCCLPAFSFLVYVSL